jgi:hypothetical protein
MGTLTTSEAMEAGFQSVTSPYSDDEHDLLQRAVSQFSGVRIALVRTKHGIEIWRVAKELKGTSEGDAFSAADTKHPRHFGR